MERATIVSSNIDEIGFEDNTLFIRFHSGVTYSYAECGYHYFDTLKKVESAGKFFHRWIKGKFQYTRLEKDPSNSPDCTPNSKALVISQTKRK